LIFLEQLKTSDILSFTVIMRSDESQSKAQFIRQSLGENETGYRAKNIAYNFFPQMKTSRKVHISLHCIFIPSW